MGTVTFKTQDELAAEALESWRASAAVSAFQARAALAHAGLLETVQALMDSPDASPEMKIAWEYATEFRRRSPTVLAMANGLGLDELALDQLFEHARTIEA